MSHNSKNTNISCDSITLSESQFLNWQNTTMPFKTDRIDSPVNVITPFERPVKQKKKDNKKKKKEHSKSKIVNKIDGHRGIDTLLRNAQRAQLDMLSLAAVKANIMISLNGLLISMMLISGSRFVSIDAIYSIPTILFLLSSALAIVFAVLAAQPDISRKIFSPKDFRDGNAHLLSFEEFSDLSQKQYMDEMTYMMESSDRVYQNMITHIHELGSMADRKYRKLHCSYTVFVCGIILSILSLLVIEAMRWSEQTPTL